MVSQYVGGVVRERLVRELAAILDLAYQAGLVPARQILAAERA